MVIAAGRDERGAGPVAHDQVEPEHITVEAQRPVEIRHLASATVELRDGRVVGPSATGTGAPERERGAT